MILFTFAAMNLEAGVNRESDENCSVQSCAVSLNGIKDALYVLNGKWKLPLIFTLCSGPMRFKDIQRAVGDITPRMLSKELKELELNEFVVREAASTDPIAVTYQLTPYSRSLDKILFELKDWGIQHRQHIVTSRKKQR